MRRRRYRTGPAPRGRPGPPPRWRPPPGCGRPATRRPGTPAAGSRARHGAPRRPASTSSGISSQEQPLPGRPPNAGASHSTTSARASDRRRPDSCNGKVSSPGPSGFRAPARRPRRGGPARSRTEGRRSGRRDRSSIQCPHRRRGQQGQGQGERAVGVDPDPQHRDQQPPGPAPAAGGPAARRPSPPARTGGGEGTTGGRRGAPAAGPGRGGARAGGPGRTSCQTPRRPRWRPGLRGGPAPRPQSGPPVQPGVEQRGQPALHGPRLAGGDAGVGVGGGHRAPLDDEVARWPGGSGGCCRSGRGPRPRTPAGPGPGRGPARGTATPRAGGWRPPARPRFGVAEPVSESVRSMVAGAGWSTVGPGRARRRSRIS